MSAAPRQPGTIITFYSYKGGTGRSMALANVSWILASNGYRVLVVDWDLEAPGLHRYFAPFMLDPDLTESDGVIDMVNDYAAAALTKMEEPEHAAAEAVASPEDWVEPYANILRYATSLDYDFLEHEERKGWIDVVPAGRQGVTYTTRMNTFSWQNFYDRFGGGGFIERIKQRMKAEYDYVLIDSRTGVSDTSGICTVQLPDVLAVCFTLNRQSIEGASAVATSVRAQRGDTLRIFPIPARVEKAEKEKLEVSREVAKEEFAPLISVSGTDLDQYWGQVEMFYEPFYAYEEVLAVFGDKPMQTNSLLASMERITSWLTERKVTQLAPVDEAARHRILGKYARQSRKGTQSGARDEYLFYISYSRSDRDEHFERFVDDLCARVRAHKGLPPSAAVCFVDYITLNSPEAISVTVTDSLRRSRVLVPVFSPTFFETEHAGREFQHFLSRGTPEAILPVMWVKPATELPSAAAKIHIVDPSYPDAYDSLGLRSIMRLRQYQDIYTVFVDAFARRIVEIADRVPLPATLPPPVHELPNAFMRLVATSRLPSSQLLIGRESELAMLDAAWSGELKKNVVTIVAFGGIGKSTLAAHWAATKMNDLERYFDWSFYRQGSSDAFVKTALEFFGDAALAASVADGWQKGERLAQLVAQHRTLLILDGLEPLQDAKTGELRDPALQSLLRGLAARNPGLCLVTTRQEIPDLDTFRTTTAAQWKLAHLSTEAGASLLELLGVRGTATERETLAGDVKGHALTLTLLGKFLAEAHGGEIRRRDLVSLHEADSEETHGHAFRVMEAYEQWLARDGREVELAILQLLGLFDRPATPDCLSALREAPAIDGLTDSLVTLTEAQWNRAVKLLVQLGFVEQQPWEPPRIAGYGEEEARRIKAERIRLADAQPPQTAPEKRMAGSALDAHPLIREYFARRLGESAPEAWRAAHGRLYEHLRNCVPYWPEGVDGLRPLYQAVVHGCLAGRAAETCNRVYHDRILRGTSGPYAYYSRRMLGLTVADLAAVRSFFTVPWKELAADLNAAHQSWLLNEAANGLRALGRLDEAREPLRAALEAVVALENWRNAAIYVGNLSELNLTLGDVISAVRYGEQSVQYATRSGDAFQIMAKHATHADALHQAGRAAEAGDRFREAEALQGERTPTMPFLYSLENFQVSDLLLAGTERAAWHRYLGPDKERFEAQLLSDVEHRTTTAMAIAMRNKWLLVAALDNLTLGRIALLRAILGNAALDSAHMRVEGAVRGLRQSGEADMLPRALLTRAWLHAMQGDPVSARADLDEAQQIAERGSMRLHLADVHLHRARLFFRENRDEAREELKKARALIERCSYHRRDEELRDAEAVI